MKVSASHEKNQIFLPMRLMGCQGLSLPPHQTGTIQNNPDFVFLVSHTHQTSEQTQITKQFSPQRSTSQCFQWVGQDLASCYGVGPDWPGVCFCAPLKYVKVLPSAGQLKTTAVTLPIFSCTFTNVQTASGPRDLFPRPHISLGCTHPRMMGLPNTKESQDTTKHILFIFFFLSLLFVFIQTHFNSFTHEKECRI